MEGFTEPKAPTLQAPRRRFYTAEGAEWDPACVRLVSKAFLAAHSALEAEREVRAPDPPAAGSAPLLGTARSAPNSCCRPAPPRPQELGLHRGLLLPLAQAQHQDWFRRLQASRYCVAAQRVPTLALGLFCYVGGSGDPLSRSAAQRVLDNQATLAVDWRVNGRGCPFACSLCHHTERGSLAGARKLHSAQWQRSATTQRRVAACPRRMLLSGAPRLRRLTLWLPVGLADRTHM